MAAVQLIEENSSLVGRRLFLFTRGIAHSIFKLKSALVLLLFPELFVQVLLGSLCLQ